MKRDKDGTKRRRKCGWIRKNEKKRKGKKERRESKQERERERRIRSRERERKGREKQKKREIFSAFRLSNLDGLRVNVDPRIAGYMWVPKSWSFVKLCEVRNFLTCIISNLKII